MPLTPRRHFDLRGLAPLCGGGGTLCPVCWCIHLTMRQLMDSPCFRASWKKSSYTCAGHSIEMRLVSGLSLIKQQITGRIYI